MKKIKYNGTDEVVLYEKLDNGIDVYLYPKDTAENFYITYNTRFGSINTKFKVEGSNEIIEVPNGSAHYLEHQMFQMKDGDAFGKFAKLGSSVNAFTTYDLTCYEVVASSNFKENLELLLDVVDTPYFTKKSVDNERGIIKEEINMYDDNANARSSYGLEYNLNINDRHKYLISGTIDDIDGITNDTLYTLHDAFYQSSNMFIVITGKFKAHEALGIIRENQSTKEIKPYKKITNITTREPIKVEKEYEVIKMDVTTPKISYALKIPKKNFKGFKDYEIPLYMNLILRNKFGSTSDILELMQEENLIDWNIYPTFNVRKDYVSIVLSLESNYKEEVIKLIREAFCDLSFDEKDIRRLCKVSISNFIMHFDNIISVCEDIQGDIINFGSIQNDVMNLYKNIDIDRIREFTKRIDTSCECIYIVDKDQ